MNKINRSKLIWRKALGALAIGLGTIGYLDAPATAKPLADSFQLAQVGVRSRITPPTPLNLRPRTHTPLPQGNYSRYPRYKDSYDNYRSHDHDHHHHDDYHHSHHKNTNHGRRKNRGRVIIISPGSHGSSSNYNNRGYIRIIRN